MSAEERRGEELLLSSFSASLCESLRLCVIAVLTSAAPLPRCVSCAFLRLVPLRLLRPIRGRQPASRRLGMPRRVAEDAVALADGVAEAGQLLAAHGGLGPEAKTAG